MILQIQILGMLILIISKINTKRIFIILFLAFSYNCNSQIIDSKICDSTDRFPITQYVSILKTTTQISLDSALYHNAQHHFVKAPHKPVLVFNYDPYYYWFRIIISNKQPYPKDLMLLMAPIGLRDGQLFQNKDTGWKLIAETGLKYPFKQRPYQFTHNVLPFTINAHSIDTLYFNADASNSYKSFGFALIKPKDLKVFENKLYFTFGIIIGLLLLFFIFNIALFFILRVKVHLWYALYIGFLFLIVMKNDNLDQEFLHWDSEFAYQVTPYVAIGSIAISILIHVVQIFLKATIQRKTFLYNVSYAVKINVFLSGLAHLIFYNVKPDYQILSFILQWAKYSMLIAIIMIIIDCIYSIAKGFKNAFFILAGLLVFLIGGIQRLFFPSTLSFLFPPTTLHIGIIMEAILISLGLVYQYYWIEKEQDRQRENAFKQELHNAQLEIQEQTMKDISWEIHDNVGQILSLAKLNINTMNFKEPALLQEKINNSSELVGKAIHDLRNLAKSLNTDYVTERGLINLIQNELEQVTNIGKHTTTLLQEGDSYQLSHQQFLFRIFQEVLNNAIKHSEATLITVKVCFMPLVFEIQIMDNGKGFDYAALPENNNSGLGIRNIKNRLKIIGGDCRIESKLNGGTTIFIKLPISE